MLKLTRTTDPYLVGVDGDTRTFVRVTVGPVSNVRRVRHARYMAEADEYAQAEYGAAIADLLADEDREIVAMAQTCLVRAGMMAALRKVEVGVQRGDGDIEWTATDLPDEWATLEGFIDNLPGGLLVRWHEAVQATNAGLFFVPDGEEQKKREPSNGNASVTPLTAS